MNKDIRPHLITFAVTLLIVTQAGYEIFVATELRALRAQQLLLIDLVTHRLVKQADSTYVTQTDSSYQLKKIPHEP
jgi:hypothetical protein